MVPGGHPISGVTLTTHNNINDQDITLCRDDCRRALRKLELEAYSSVTSVLRAQGYLTDERKNILQVLRTVLHISQDRHSAEVRRAVNDPLLTVIAERLNGPNTDLDWTCEGRRKIPILPRGIPQTLYTAIADQAARLAARENEKIITPEQIETEEQIEDVKTYTRSRPPPPIVMSDQSIKTATEDGPPRKRGRPDPSSQHGRPSHQRFLNLSQVYSNYSKPPSKVSNQYGKSSHGQIGKLSAKSSHGHPTKSTSKQRSSQGKHGKHSGQVAIPHRQVRGGMKSPTDPHMAGSQAVLSPVDSKSQTSGFQANFAQSLVRPDDPESDVKPLLDSPTMQLLTQTPIRDATSLSSDESGNVNSREGQSPGVTPQPKIQQGCQVIFKRKSDNAIEKNQKMQVGNLHLLSKASDLSGLKVLQNRQLLVSNSSPQKILNSSGKLITTKMVQQIPQKSQAQINTSAISKSHPGNVMEKLLIVSKPPISPVGQTSILQRSLSNSSSKNFILSNQGGQLVSPSIKEESKHVEVDPSKNITLNNAKTIFVNPKMVVLPTKPRTKGQLIGQPVFVKGIQGKTSMKFVPVSNQSPGSQTKSPSLTTSPKSMTTLPRLLPKESKSHNADSSNDITANVQLYPKSSQPLMKPNAKGNIYVVQSKGNNITKGAITISKNGSDLSKVVMSNKVINCNSPISPLDVAVSKVQTNVNDKNKNVCDTISLEIKSEEITIDSDLPGFLVAESAAAALTHSNTIKMEDGMITDSTPVIFTQQIGDVTCNADSMDSNTDSAMGSINNEEPVKSNDSFAIRQLDESVLLTGESSEKRQIISDWEMESDNAIDKQKISNEVDEFHLTLDASSGSDLDDYLTTKQKVIGERESHRGDNQISDDTSQLRITPSNSNGDSSSSRVNKLNVQDKNFNLAHTDVRSERDSSRRLNRPDIFSTTLTSADINLDSFEYLDEEMFPLTKGKGRAEHLAFSSDKDIHDTVEREIVQLLNEDHIGSARSILEPSQASSGAME